MRVEMDGKKVRFPAIPGEPDFFFIRGSIGKLYGPWDRTVRTAGRPTYVIPSSVLHRRADERLSAQYKHTIAITEDSPMLLTDQATAG
ncbi:hypothetical protein ACFCP7_12175 [Paenibacillus elgii]